MIFSHKFIIESYFFMITNVIFMFERKEDAEKAKAALREDRLAKDLFVTAFTDKTCVPV